MRNVEIIETMKSTIIALTILFSCVFTMAQSDITYTFDKHGRLVTEHYESVYKVLFSYDKEGNLETKGVIGYSGSNSLPKAVKETGILVYPNPADEYIIIDAEVRQQTSKIVLTDISGRVVKDFIASALPLKIELPGIVSGLYLINIQSEREDVWISFVKK
jgi:hypothetical protein